jgi:predicted GNAT family N-acyltransferase
MDALEVVVFGPLSDSQRAELEAGEEDPFDGAGNTLAFRPKDQHVALRQADGRLIASTGFVLAELRVDEGPPVPFVGIGGVFVTAERRGQGLGNRILEEALRFGGMLGPDFALLFCHRDRSGLYLRHGFTEVEPPVLVEQPGGQAEIPLVTMWRPLGEGPTPSPGRLSVGSLPF